MLIKPNDCWKLCLATTSDDGCAILNLIVKGELLVEGRSQ